MYNVKLFPNYYYWRGHMALSIILNIPQQNMPENGKSVSEQIVCALKKTLEQTSLRSQDFFENFIAKIFRGMDGKYKQTLQHIMFSIQENNE